MTVIRRVQTHLLCPCLFIEWNCRERDRLALGPLAPLIGLSEVDDGVGGHDYIGTQSPAVASDPVAHQRCPSLRIRFSFVTSRGRVGYDGGEWDRRSSTWY